MRRIDSGVLGCLAASLLVLCGLMGCGGTPTTGMDASKGVDVPKQTDAPKQTASQEGVQVLEDSDNNNDAEQDREAEKDAEKKAGKDDEQDAEKDAGGEEAGGFVATTLSKLGSFPAQTIEGAGDDVVEIPCAGFPCVIDIVHNGESNFAVKACDSTGNSVKLLVNEIGYYRGTVTTVAVFDEASLLQVKADGGWAMTFKPMSQMERAENGSAFKGDGVVYIDTASLTKVHFTHNGSSNFAVKGISLSSEKLLVNEIGPYDGTVIWNEPQSFFVVSADGDWSISW